MVIEEEEEQQPSALDVKVGLLGELEVELQLVQQGWHPVRLDTAQMAANADLIAVNRSMRVSIQVKTTNNDSQHKRVMFGYARRFLTEDLTFFNSKASPLIADVVIAVSYAPDRRRFVILPVGLAEKLCQYHAKYWYAVLTKKGKQRSAAFPIYLAFNAEREAHGKHHEKIKRNVRPYENAWEILKESPDKLRDPKAWPLLK